MSCSNSVGIASAAGRRPRQPEPAGNEKADQRRQQGWQREGKIEPDAVGAGFAASPAKQDDEGDRSSGKRCGGGEPPADGAIPSDHKGQRQRRDGRRYQSKNVGKDDDGPQRRRISFCGKVVAGSRPPTALSTSKA